MNILDKLNREQRMAAKSVVDGSTVVIAGAGSGKTTVITRSIAHLVKDHQVNPYHILLLTFTNKAAKEMMERAANLVGKDSKPQGGTFHSFALRTLRRYANLIGYNRNFTIMDPSDINAVVTDAMTDVCPDVEFSEGLFYSSMAWATSKGIDTVKHIRKRVLDYDGERLPSKTIRKLLVRIAEIKAKMGVMDFDDFLINFNRIYDENPDMIKGLRSRFPYVFVDEMQDTNIQQMRMLQHLVGPKTNFMVVGDDAQCLDGNSQIEMGDGSLKPIKCVKVGDHVMSSIGGIKTSCPVYYATKTRKHHHVELTLDNGSSLNGSGDHLVFACVFDSIEELGDRINIEVSLAGRKSSEVTVESQHLFPQSVRNQLAKIGWNVSDGKRKTGRARRLFQEGDVAEVEARRLALFIAEHFNLPARVFTFLSTVRGPYNEKMLATTLSAIVPGMYVWDGSAIIRVSSRRMYKKDKDVYDIGVVRGTNYFANGICVHNSIYSWRGAVPENLSNIPKLFSTINTVKLEQNYRSTPEILNLANELQAQMNSSFQKKLFTTISSGPVPSVHPFHDDRSEGLWIIEQIKAHLKAKNPLKEFAVLYRFNRIPTTLEMLLNYNKIPYKKYGGLDLFSTKHIKDFLATIKTAINPNDSTSAKRLLALCRGVGNVRIAKIWDCAGKTLSQKIKSFGYGKNEDLNRLRSAIITISKSREDPPVALSAALRFYANTVAWKRMDNERKDDVDAVIRLGSGFQNIMSMVDNLTLDPNRSKEDRKSSDCIVLSTIHSCKGLEWDHVVFMGVADGTIPAISRFSGKLPTKSEIEEERRLAYVACTRPRKRLQLSYVFFDQSKDDGLVEPCRFLQPCGSALYWHKNRILNRLVESGQY